MAPRKKRIAKPKRFTRYMQKKLLILFMVVIGALAALNIKITYINAEKGDQYTRQVLDQQNYDSRTIAFKRGDILDVNGTKLATSTKVYNVILDCKIVNTEDSEGEKKYRQPTIQAIIQFFDIEEDELVRILDEQPDSQYYVLQKQISYEQMQEFETYVTELSEKKVEKGETRQEVKGVWFEENYLRNYPYGTLASHVIGFTVDGNLGNVGLENYYNDELNGTNGREYGYWSEESELERTIKAAHDGNSIVTNIDVNLQMIAEKYIDAFMEEYSNANGPGAKNVSVVMMNPQNGAVLTIANSDNYDLNNPRDLSTRYSQEQLDAMSDEETIAILQELWKNYAVSETYEPGSTVKPMTVAAAMETGNGIAGFQCNGAEVINGKPIKCNKVHNHVTLKESIMVSCNVAMMRLAAQMGMDVFATYQEIFNFGTRTGIDLPGEAAGLLYDIEAMSAIDLGTNSFGQNFTVNMIQVASAFSSLINGGYYYKPQVVNQIIDSDGAVVSNIEPVVLKQTVSAKTSEFLKDSLLDTVQQELGTAKAARIEGYLVSGKTGTAQKYPRSERKHLVSFIGFVPYDDPQLVIYVTVDEFNSSDDAQAPMASTLAQKILTEALEYLQIYPTEPIEGQENSGENPEAGQDDGEPIDDILEAGALPEEGEPGDE